MILTTMLLVFLLLVVRIDYTKLPKELLKRTTFFIIGLALVATFIIGTLLDNYLAANNNKKLNNLFEITNRR